MAKEAEIDAVLVRAAVARLEAKGVSPAPLLSRVGIDLDILSGLDQRIPLEKSDLFYEQAALETDEDLFGFKTGRDTDPGFFGLLAYLGISAQTLGGALRNHIRFLNVFIDGHKLDLDVVSDRAVLLYVVNETGTRSARQAKEAGMAVLVSVYRYATGRNLRPKEVRFLHPRQQVPSEMERFFGCPVRFGCDDHGLVFRESDLDIPLVHADRHLEAYLQTVGETILAQRREHHSSFLSRVEEYVVSGLKEGRASSKHVADSLAISERTLSRRLNEEGMTFKSIVETIRQDLAKEYLAKSSLSLPEIAYILGYSDTPAFSRAFKRWTGATPGSFAAERRSQ